VDFQPPLLQLSSHFISNNGAVQSSNDLPTAFPGLDQLSRRPTQYLDFCGRVITLPSDLTALYASHASLLQLASSIRYSFDRVYSSNGTKRLDMEGAGSLSSHGDIHLQSSEEGVLDIIVPSRTEAVEIDELQVFAETEVLCAMQSVVRSLGSQLPPCAMRLTDSQLVDCILEVCAWTEPPLPPSTGPSPAKSKNQLGHAFKGYFSQLRIERTKLLKSLSLLVDMEMEGSAEKYIGELFADLALPPIFLKRFSPFVSILSSQHTKGGGIVKVIDLLEEVVCPHLLLLSLVLVLV
jgi:hypothetical protein